MDMVVKIMQAGVPTQFDLEKYSTPLLRHWREKGRKRTANEAFLTVADSLVDLELSPRIKRVVRRPPPSLTIYVRRESEKAYNAIMLEETTAENLKLAVAMKYNTPTDSINSFQLRCKEGIMLKMETSCNVSVCVVVSGKHPWLSLAQDKINDRWLAALQNLFGYSKEKYWEKSENNRERYQKLMIKQSRNLLTRMRSLFLWIIMPRKDVVLWC